MGRNNNYAYINSLFEERNDRLQVGKIVEVTTRYDNNQVTNHTAKIDMQNDDLVRHNVHIPVMLNGEVCIPKKGDMVLIDFEDAESPHESPYVVDITYTNKTRAPMGEPGLYKVVRGIKDRLRPNQDPDGLENDTFSFEHDMRKEYMRFGWRDENTDGNQEPTKWFGLHDNPEHPEEEPQMVASEHGTDYPLIGSEFDFSGSEVERMDNDPAILGRVQMEPEQVLNVLSISLSDDTPEVPNSTELIVYDQTDGSPGTELRSLFEQQPGTSEGSGWRSNTVPISVDTGYTTPENAPMESNRDEYRRRGEPIWSLSYSDEFGSGSEPRYIGFGISSPSGTNLSASISGRIGREQTRDTDEVIYEPNPQFP